MDDKGFLHRLQIDDESREKLERKQGAPLIPLTDRQYQELEPLGAKQRKGFMRNQSCVCGSGKKFKRCCWSKYSPRRDQKEKQG